MNDDYNYDAYQYGNTTDTPVTEDSVTDTDYSTESYVNFTMPEISNEPPKSEPPKKKCWKKWLLCAGLAVLFGVLAGIAFQATNRLSYSLFGEDKVEKIIEQTQTDKKESVEVNSDIAQVAHNVMPSVVSITNLSVQEVQNFFFGGYTTQEYQSSGSGIIIGQSDSELLMVTNNHVVEGSTTLTVTFCDEQSVQAKIKGTNADMDVAVIAVPLTELKEDTLDAIKVATLGDSDKIVVGEPAIAIGNALGYGQSVTAGIISATERSLEGFDAELIQTDAAINPGNSGGALVNIQGEVIGINTVKVNADAVEGMGYAIPISDLSDLLDELMNRETRERVDADKQGYIGIEGVTVDATASQLYGMPEGVHVSGITKGSGADKANLPKGCIITEFDGRDIDSMQDLQECLQYYKAGETVEIEVEVPGENGEYKEKTYEIKLGDKSTIE